MTTKGRVKRGLCLFLMTALTVTSFTACGKKEKKTQENIVTEATSSSKDYVFKSEELTIDGLETSRLNGMQLIGDRIYFSVADDNHCTTQMASFKTDGSDLKLTDLKGADDLYLYGFAYNDDGSCYAIGYSASSLGFMAPSGDASSADASDEAASDEASAEASTDASSDGASADDSAAASSESSEDSGEESTAKQMNFSGNMEQFLLKIDAEGNVEKIDISSQSEGGDEYSFYGIIGIKGNKALISSTKGLETYSSEEGFKTIVDTVGDPKYQGQTFTLYQGSDDKIFALSYIDGKEEVFYFDPETGKFSEPLQGFKERLDFNSGMFFGGCGYDLYISDSSAVYGYDAKEDKIFKLMDFIDSDLEVNFGIYNAVALSDTEFIVSMPGFNNDYQLLRLTKVPADQVKDKTVITLGGSNIDYRFRQQVVAYNQTNDKYKIKIVDYSSYNTETDYEAGDKQFDLDIVAGNIPDIMVFGPNSEIDKYINKGVFLDYKPYLDKDEDLKGVEILPNLKKIMTRGDKMYTLIPSFEVSSMVTAKNYVGDKTALTFEECDEIIKQHNTDYETAFQNMTKASFLNRSIVYAGDKYVDWQNKKCSFNTEDFCKLLEFANNFPEEIDYQAQYDNSAKNFNDGKTLFATQGLYGFRGYAAFKQALFGKDVAFIGTPNASGDDDSVILPDGSFAISAQTQYADAAWDFIKSFLSDDYQNKLVSSGTVCFPVTKTGFETTKAASMDRPYIESNGKKEYYDDQYPALDGTMIKLVPLTQEEADYVGDFILSLDKAYSHNSSIEDIISEEAGAYFSGQKTAQEVSEIIQSRVSIYVNENS